MVEEITPIANMNIDIKRVADELFLGPQAQLVEKIQNFNGRYGRHCSNGSIIQINKNYGFKPGTYDRIKEAFGNHCLGYKSKPKDIWSLQFRMDRNRWRQRNFWTSAISIQQDMWNLKNSGSGWQDNVEVVEEFWNNLKERIPSEIENALNVFTNDTIDIGIQTSDSSNNMKIIVEIFTSDINMQVIHQNDEIANYLWGNVATRWTIPLWSFINNWCEGGRQSRNNHSINNPKGKLYPKYPRMRHPYISQHHYYVPTPENPNPWIGNSCTGDLQNDLKESIWSLNIEAICTLTRSWLSRYHIPRTNPLNRIEHCHYGWEIGMDEKIWKHRDSSPESEISRCKWPDVFSSLNGNTNDIDNACDECQFKEGYAYLVDSSDISEDAEYPGQRVVEVEPCNRAIVEYECPETDEDIISEACIMHIMCCNILRNGSINTRAVEENLDWRLTDENRFPADANLETIYRLEETFNFSSAFRGEQLNWPVRSSEDLLDAVFNTRIWHNLVDEYIELYELCDGDAEDASYDLRNESITRIREMIDNEHQRRDNSNGPSQIQDIITEETPFDPLTPEESAIRWATQNGRTLNI
jgi:hypothetical protein|tara:strand:- start:1047 stop:2795 length:1749 start_codon:yes stop_codon:yes gene_type:complete